MTRRLAVLLALLLSVGIVTPASAAAAPRIGAVSQSAPSLPALTPLRISAGVSADFTNPDDPAQIAVSATITGPSGTVEVPGFLFQDYRIDHERIVPKGQPVWQIRYTPPRAGAYRYTVRAGTPGGTATAPARSFVVTPPKADVTGYARIDADNPAYLTDDHTGKTFFPMGFNTDVPELTKPANHQADPDARYHGIFGDGITSPPLGQTPESLYQTYKIYHDGLTDLAHAGGNAVRVILDSWLLPLELDPASKAWPGFPNGVPGFSIGQYNPANAWLMDQVLDLAARLHIRVTMVSWDGQTSGAAFDAYARPANADPALMERRLRYQVARWSYGTNLLAWELFNESDAATGQAPYADVVAYLRATDPAHRPVFDTWNGIDETETHTYLCGDGENDPSNHFYFNGCPQQTDFLDWARFTPTGAKPSLLSEFGQKWYFRFPAGQDPTGTRAHEGLWASLMGHKAGAQYWWFYAHLQPLNLYDGVYRGISRYLSDVDLAAYDWHAADVTQAAGPGGLTYRGMTQDATGGPRALLWFVRTPSNSYTDRPAADGNVARLGGMQPGRYAIDWYSTETGRVLTTTTANADATGGVPLAVPDGVTRDVAAKVRGPLGATHLTVDSPAAGLEPGETGTVRATLTSTGATPAPTGIALSLAAPAGWQVHANGPATFAGPLPPGKSVTATWQVTAPDDGAPGTFPVSATATYASGGEHTVTQQFGLTALPPPLSDYGPVTAPYQTFASTTAEFHQRDNRFAVVAGGADMWLSTDQYGAVYLPGAAAATSSVTTEVTYQQASDTKAKAGIMMRNAVAENGRSAGYVVLAVTPGNNFVLNWDSNGNGFLDAAMPVGATAYPAWLRLDRAGDQYTASYSTDNQTWHRIATVTAPGAAPTQDAGLVVSAHAASGTSRADFTGLDVSNE